MTSPPTFIHEHQHSYTKYRIYPKYFDRQASEKSVDSKKDVSTLFNTSWRKTKKKSQRSPSETENTQIDFTTYWCVF